MLISANMADMLVKLALAIRIKLNVRIGYSRPVGTNVNDSDDFVVFLDDDGQNHFVYKLDLVRNRGVIADEEYLSEVLMHDDKAVEMVGKIEAALLDGEIGFDPGITREFKCGNEVVLISCSKMADSRIDVSIESAGDRRLYCASLDQLKKQAELNQLSQFVFKVASELG